MFKEEIRLTLHHGLSIEQVRDEFRDLMNNKDVSELDRTDKFNALVNLLLTYPIGRVNDFLHQNLIDDNKEAV